MQTPPNGRPARLAALAVLLPLALGSCASLEFTQDTQTSGHFRSTGFAFTILAIDVPKTAEQIARENASDANLANTIVEEVVVYPYLGWFDWLLDVVGVRWARVSGTWGFPGEE
jgi:hypothetical protein